MRFSPLAVILASLLAQPVHASGQEAPPALAQAMIDAAFETGEPDQIKAVADAAKKVFVENAEAIDAYAEPKLESLIPPEPVTETAPIADEKKGVLAVAPWDGKVSASGVFANGNSENLAAGIAIDARREAGEFAHNINANFDYGQSNSIQNLKRWGAAYQLDYKFDDRTYTYGRLSYTEDQFSGFDYRLFAGAGLGHFYYKSEEFTWKVEGGPGYQYSPIDDSREISKEFALYASSETDWIIREGVKLEQDFSVTWTSPTTTFISVTALTTALTDSISAGLAYEARYETNPPDLRKNTDTVLRANLAYGF